MHGMLSLWVLVAAFAGLAGWAGYVSVRLYRTCPAAPVSSAPLDTGAAVTGVGPVSADTAPDNADASRTGPAGYSSPAGRTGSTEHPGPAERTRRAERTRPAERAEPADNQTTSPHPVA